MGRPSKKINPKCGQRLKIILKEQNTTQQQLSEMIHLTQVTISNIICGKASLTDENADAIHVIFPQYRLQWLLGYDDYKTEEEIKRSLLPFIEREQIKASNFIEGIAMIASMCKYNLAFTNEGMSIKPFDSDEKAFDLVAAAEFKEDVLDFFTDRLDKLYKRGH